jgi:hypothetical protein
MKKISRSIFIVVILSMLSYSCGDEGGDSSRTNLPSWTLATQSAEFNPRDTNWTTVFKGKMYTGNGWYHGGAYSRDLWASSEGRTWILVSDNTPYEPFSQLTVFKDKMWAIGGGVWSSENGKDWKAELAATPFGVWGETVVHKGILWRIATGDYGVWKSSDGIHWELANKDPQFGSRYWAGIVSFKSKLWLMGGRTTAPNHPPELTYPEYTTFNDVWTSEDGITWERMMENAPWEPRMWHKVSVYEDKIWLLGGLSNRDNCNLNDVWVSEDGMNWKKMEFENIWSPRHEFGVCVFDNKLWVIGGNAWPVVNDVWYFKR